MSTFLVFGLRRGILSFFLSSMCLSTPVFADPPPNHVPEEFRDQFTMGGRIPVLERYLYHPTPEGRPTVFSQQAVDDCVRRVKRGETGYYGVTDTWLYQALKKYPIAGKEVGIFGSTTPLYESVVLAYGGIL